MPTQAQKDASESLRLEGNMLFSKGRYGAAIEKYTEAITLFSTNPVLYANRALAYRKKDDWINVMQDATTALSFDKDHMKANYLAGLAHLQKPDYEVGVKHLNKALELAREANDTIKDDIWRELALAKFAQWQRDSAERKAKVAALKEVVAAVGPNEQLQGSLAWLYEAIEKQDTPSEVPSVFTCPLTIHPFRDPVITKYGHSYERGVLLEHLKKSKWDPVTRQALTEKDIVPNVALRQAVQQYLDEHPYAWKECF